MEHTRPNSSNATSGLIGVSFLLATALISYTIRMYSRIRPVFKLAASDYFVTAGLACALITLATQLANIGLGASGYDEYISTAARIKIGKLSFVMGMVSFWASSLSRISIGCMLLSFPISKAWKITLWVLLAIQVVMPIGANIFTLLQCRPVRASWEPVSGAVCWSNQVSQIYGYIYAAFGTLSDIIFATMPVHIFWSLNRPLLERVLGIVLMGLGTIAAIASAMKIYHISEWNPREAQFRDWIPLQWWYRVEEIVLVVAACAPFLKPLMKRVLGGLGASRFRFRTIRLHTIQEEETKVGDSTLERTKVGGSTLETTRVKGSTLENNVFDTTLHSS
ncbi:hypothetical protein GQ44DRAFT_493994 [Phaeosphaeriaceae sp. PMI808]|nr:hypothetical protein GQ44DRAFT_493994 [Phaeosphaeriaceae sp. PMI808]